MIDLPKVFVVPAEGVKIPLPVAGMRIPGIGMTVRRDTHIERLLRTQDLLEGDAAAKLATTRQAAIDAANEKAAKELAEKEAAELAKNTPPATEEAKAPAAAMAPSPAIAPAAEVKPQPVAAKAEK